jgi:hypothetical protein
MGAGQARLAPLTLMAGLATGVTSVALHQLWWGLALSAATTFLLLFAAPPGWGTRLPFGLGYVGAVALLAVPRPEGDYLISSDIAGYLQLGITLVVLVVSIATLPRHSQSPPPT